MDFGTARDTDGPLPVADPTLARLITIGTPISARVRSRISRADRGQFFDARGERSGESDCRDGNPAQGVGGRLGGKQHEWVRRQAPWPNE
jgi:hypothetical protein